MRKATRDRVYNTLSKNNKAAISVKSDETFVVETQLNGGDWPRNIDDLWDPSKSRGPNLCTVIEVEDARPGNSLAVHIIDVKPGELGYTGFAGRRNPLSQLIYPNNWDVVTKTVRIKDDYVEWSDELKLPIMPMIGTIGTAPAAEDQTTKYAYTNGGTWMFRKSVRVRPSICQSKCKERCCTSVIVTRSWAMEKSRMAVQLSVRRK